MRGESTNKYTYILGKLFRKMYIFREVEKGHLMFLAFKHKKLMQKGGKMNLKLEKGEMI